MTSKVLMSQRALQDQGKHTKKLEIPDWPQ